MSVANATVLARFKDFSDAEAAVNSLRKSGVQPGCISLLGRHFNSREGVHGFFVRSPEPHQAPEHRETRTGEVFGSLFKDLLVGSAGVLILPELGPLLVLGPVGNFLLTAATTAEIHWVAEGLMSTGVSRETAHGMEAALGKGEFLCLAHVQKAEAEHAAKVLDAAGPLELREVSGNAPA
jgi:hypothetical protein